MLTKFGISFIHSTSGTSPPNKEFTCEAMLEPSLQLPFDKSININSDSLSINCGVTDKFISLIAVKAEIIKERGEVTDLFFPLSSHSVDIERESLPTGIAISH